MIFVLESTNLSPYNATFLKILLKPKILLKLLWTFFLKKLINELRVSSYCLFHELRVFSTYKPRVTVYCTNYELLLLYELLFTWFTIQMKIKIKMIKLWLRYKWQGCYDMMKLSWRITLWNQLLIKNLGFPGPCFHVIDI